MLFRSLSALFAGSRDVDLQPIADGERRTHRPSDVVQVHDRDAPSLRGSVEIEVAGQQPRVAVLRLAHDWIGAGANVPLIGRLSP